MLSSVARAMCARVVPRSIPMRSPRAYMSQCGAPRPVKAGTKYTPSLPRRLAARRCGRRAGVREEETARAVGVLRFAGDETGLTEERRLLIARDPGDRQWRSEVRCIGLTDDAHRSHRSREHRARQIERREQL